MANLMAKKSKQAINCFPYLALSASILVYLLIVIGGIVRVTDASGLCLDWLTCGGSLLPPFEIKAFSQYAYRLLTLLSFPVITILVIRAWQQYRQIRIIFWPSVAALALFLLQAAIGALVFLSQTPPDLVALHFALGLIMLAALISTTVGAFIHQNSPKNNNTLTFSTPFKKKSLLAFAGLFVVLVSGVYVAMSEATFACSGWPLCNGELFPNHPLAWVYMGHRLLVALGAIFMLALLSHAWKTQRNERAILSAATLAVVLYFSQALIAALNIAKSFPPHLLALHQASSAAVWAALTSLVILLGLSARTEEEEQAEEKLLVDNRQRFKDFVALTKPIIVVLLLVTTYAGMVVAKGEFPSISLTFWTLLGGALAAGGAGAVNQYIDRELDQNMTRTAQRPLASGRLTPAEGLAYALGLLVISFFIYMGFVNSLAAFLALAGMFYYIFLYSVWLKRATVQNIVIGGGAGAIPPLVGWAAASGRLDLLAFLLFAIIFMWTPPHFWALALVRQKDYARAGIPMLPVVKGEKFTRNQIFIYTILLVALTLLLPVLSLTGSFYLYSAIVLGLMLIYIAWLVWRVGGNAIAWKMYRYSSMYLAFLFMALVADALIG